MLKNEKFNIFDIAEKNNFKRFIHFQVTLRDKINYDIELIDGFFNFSSDAKNHIKRHVVFCCQTFLRNNQLVPPRYNSFFLTYKPGIELYTFETTVIDILLECSDNDYKKISNNIKSDTIEIYLYELLEYFSYKYNLATSGKDFLNAYELCTGSFKCFLFYKNKKTGTYENSNGLITPALSIIKNENNSNLNLQKVVNTNIPAWKYFVNKTKFNYLVYNNLDCVINAAIAFESYLIFIIKEEGMYEKYINSNKNQLGFRSSLKFCLDNNIIDNIFAKKYNKGFEKIGLYISLIIHGAIDTPIVNREQARKAFETINETFNEIDENLYKQKDLL